MISLAKSRNYPVLDMTEKTYQLLAYLGPKESKKLFLHLEKQDHPNYPDGAADDTHLNEWGANVVANLTLAQLRGLYPQIPFL